MPKERRPKQIVVAVQLEDNVGFILVKRKIEIPAESVEDFEKLVEQLTPHEN